ncbi:MAG: hypothetical protein ABJA82_10120 [Myxococcales bacterium]
MCTSTSAPDFFFSTSGKPYYATDIDPGTTGALHAGTNYATKIMVHNSGGAALATVSLHVCPPGTNVTAGTAILLREKDTANPVPACTGTNDGTRSGEQSSAFNDWSYSWDPGAIFTSSPGGSAVHMCLFAQVRFTAVGGGTSYPNDSDPNTAQNAQHNIDVVDIVYPLKKRSDARQFFAFGIANPFPKKLDTEIITTLIGPESPDREMMMAASRRLAKLIGGDRLRVPEAAAMALGKERLLATHQFPLQTASDKASLERATRAVRRFGHTGEVPRDTFEQLKDSAVRPKHQVELLPGEVRQGLIDISLPPKANPGDVFVVDVRHQTKSKGGRGKLIGGLVVVFRVVSTYGDAQKAGSLV